ncbi:MAG: phospho-sugar mutase [Spirochaetota bacterium]
MDQKTLFHAAQQYIDLEEDTHFRKEVETALAAGDVQQLSDRFYTQLTFGTAGMRGVIGGGFNRINPYMVQRVTQGLADYLLSTQQEAVSVVIAYDSRNYSQTFAQNAADVLCANGIAVYLCSEITPVPLLSYAVRYLHASAGIVITASHNPAEYNGYKVYWSDGAQVTAPHDVNIVKHVEQVKTIRRNDAGLGEALLKQVPAEVFEHYYERVIASLPHREVFTEGLSHQVVFTPLHGTGRKPIEYLCSRLGVNVATVEEQSMPDGNFPTVEMPNPEDRRAMSLAVNLGQELGADIVLGTDPDADRLGVGLPSDESKSEYELLNGNQIAVLLGDYLLEASKESGDKKLVCVKSLVTTDLLAAMAASHGVECRDVLTGFKHIAVQMHAIEKEGKHFLFGAEESFGYLGVPFVYDKDAVSSAMLLIEMMLYYKQQGKNLLQRLEEIWDTYGYYQEHVLAKSYQGAEGRNTIEQIMKSFRQTPPETMGGLAVTQVVDLQDGTDGLPPADVVILKLEDGSKVVVRPSGTEPKIKYYVFTVTEAEDLHSAKRNSETKQRRLLEQLDDKE